VISAGRVVSYGVFEREGDCGKKVEGMMREKKL
jgi:hypothetical protein